MTLPDEIIENIIRYWVAREACLWTASSDRQRILRCCVADVLTRIVDHPEGLALFSCMCSHRLKEIADAIDPNTRGLGVLRCDASLGKCVICKQEIPEGHVCEHQPKNSKDT